MEPETDFPALLHGAKSGDEWAVTMLYREVHPLLARYLRAREPRFSEDIEGEVWLAIAERLRTFEGDRIAFRAWAFSIARRRLADHRRTAARRRTDPMPIDELDGPAVDDPERTVLEGISADEAAAFVVRVLPHDQAEVVLLRVVAGLDVNGVAEVLGKKPGTVRVLQHRGLRRLERHLTGNL